MEVNFNASKYRGALTVDEFEALEHALFEADNAGVALANIRKFARENLASPIAFLVQALQYVLSCMPGSVWFDAGQGRGCVNLFTVLLGAPGAGKDRLMRLIGESVHVSCDGRPLTPRTLHLGSGEGIIDALLPTSEGGDSIPTLFGESEVGTLATLMSRKGSILRSTLLDVWSGNSLGSTTRQAVVKLDQNSYTACLWVGTQPEKAHLLLDGEDDGFRHRFVWTELVDPNALQAISKRATRLLDVHVPKQVLENTAISIPDEVKQQLWNDSYHLRAYGHALHENTGHASYTQLKLAVALALLHSRADVQMSDWQRAGALMDYSRRVQQYAVSIGAEHRVDADAARLEQKEQAAARKKERTTHRRNEMSLRILEYVDVEDGQPAANWSSFMQTLNGGQKKIAAGIVDNMEKHRVVKLMPPEKRGNEPTYIERGEHYHEALAHMQQTVGAQQ